MGAPTHPRAVFVRQWDWTFGSGQKVKRTFGVFNDTQYPDPITFTRTADDRRQGSLHEDLARTRCSPARAEKFDEEIAHAAVTARQEGELLLTLSVDGKEIFRDTQGGLDSAAADAEGIGAGDVSPCTIPAGETAAFLKTSSTCRSQSVQSWTTCPPTPRC